jgi:hypothetical protein
MSFTMAFCDAEHKWVMFPTTCRPARTCWTGPSPPLKAPQAAAIQPIGIFSLLAVFLGNRSLPLKRTGPIGSVLPHKCNPFYSPDGGNMKHPQHTFGIPQLVAIVACAFLGTSAFADESTAGSHKDHASANSSMPMNQPMDHMKQDMGSMQMTGDTDRDFATMMRMHHQHGIEMAETEVAHGKDDKLKAMAKKIIASQKKESAEFDQWLSQHKADDNRQAAPSK